jgi:hypothetical protein
MPHLTLPLFPSNVRIHPYISILLILHYAILSCSGSKMCTQTTYTYTSSDCDCEYIVFVCCPRAKFREGGLPTCRAAPVIKRSERIEGGCWGTDCWMEGRRCAKEYVKAEDGALG